ELHLRCAQVRHVPSLVAPQADQRIWLVRSCAQNAARSVVLERPANQMHAVREQGRSEGVARQPFEAAPVEAKAQMAAAVHPATLARAESRAHAAFSPALALSTAAASLPAKRSCPTAMRSGCGSPIL